MVLKSSRPRSIGAGTLVYPGKRMAGRLGKRVTIRKLTVVR